MLDNIDELIEINLALLANSKEKSLFIFEFKDENNNRIKNSERFSEILEQKGIIDLESTKRKRCDLTEFGLNVYKKGGWIKFLKEKSVKKEFDNKIENISNSKLSNDYMLSKRKFLKKIS